MTRLFAVVREPGPAWVPGRRMEEQEGWPLHAAFMNDLAGDGLVVLGGPLGDGSRFLLICDAAGEEEIERRLAVDPWVPMRLLVTRSIEPWRIVLDRRETVQPEA